MKRSYILAFLMFFSTTANAATCNIKSVHFFNEGEGCFLLYNLTDSRYELRYGEAACQKRHSPASTFKIPNSLIGLDLGILNDENTTYNWDGSKQSMPVWEHDQTLASAVKYSVVWYFQRLAKQVGEAHYHDYLKRFNYGNQDISSGVTNFWLGKSLEITPEEQLTFLQKLYRNQLPVSSHATETVKKILVLESSAHSVLSGKTGSASVEGVNIGWFIGHLSSGGKEYLFVNNLTQKGNDAKIDSNYGGLAAKAVAKEILACQQLL